MSTQLTAILYSLVPLIGFGLGNALSQKPAKAIGAERLIILRGIIVSTLMLGVSILFMDQINFDLKTIISAIILSAMSYFGLFFFYKGLAVGKVGLIDPVANTRTLIVTFIAIAFLNETINAPKIIGIGIVFIGTILITINFKDIRESAILKKKSGLHFALLAALFWGMTFPFFSYHSQILGVALFSLLLETTVGFMPVLQLLKKGESIFPSKPIIKANIVHIAIVGGLSALGSIFLNLAYATGEISTTSVIAGAGPLISVSYARIFLKENLKLQQYLAGLLIISGIIVLSYF